jgi:hypothetical protein
MGLFLGSGAIIAFGCTGAPFTQGTSTSGDGGTGGTSNSTNSGTDGGTGGAPAGCDPPCQSGQYCSATTNKCTNCTDLSSIQFSAPAKLGVGLSNVNYSAYYPRTRGANSDIYLAVAMSPTNSQVETAMFLSPTKGWGPAMSITPILASMASDSAPLYLDDGAALAGLKPSNVMDGQPVLLFDSTRTFGKRQVYAWVPGVSNSPQLVTLPGTDTTYEVSQVAVAWQTKRFFWISNADSKPRRLMTALPSDSMWQEVPIQLDNGCHAPLADSPWVTPEGNVIFFASDEPDPNNSCKPKAINKPHLYRAFLDPSGQPTDPAMRVFPQDDSIDFSPSLTGDLCSLVFTRVDGNTSVGTLWGARRE